MAMLSNTLIVNLCGGLVAYVIIQVLLLEQLPSNHVNILLLIYHSFARRIPPKYSYTVPPPANSVIVTDTCYWQMYGRRT